MSNSRSPRAVRSMTIGISGMEPHPSVRRSATRSALAAGGRLAECRSSPRIGWWVTGLKDEAHDGGARMTPRRHLALATLAVAFGLALVAGAGGMTSHAGWPPDEHLVMDKGPAGHQRVLKGAPDKHNYL